MRCAFTIASVFAVAISLAGSAEADPAVSQINGKISTLGGAVATSNEDAGTAGIVGSLTLPLLYSIGLQIDGAYAQLGGENFGSGGAHLFWRDPKVGMFGIYAGYAHLDEEGGQDIGRIGAEAQYFVGNLTLDAAAGRLFVDAADTAYGRARIQYYPIDNLMLQAGFVTDGESSGTAGMEYQLTSTADYGVSLYGDGRVHDGDRYSVVGGLRIFLGENMTLKDRHRRQDPQDYAQADLDAAFQAAIAARNARQNQSTAPPDEDLAACPLDENGSTVTGVYLDAPPQCLCPSGDFEGERPEPANEGRYSCSKLDLRD